MLELQHICFERQNKKILDDINLKIDTNKFIAITGPNGSGKSTLVKIIMGIEKPDSGKVILDGKDITNLSIKYDEKFKLPSKQVEFLVYGYGSDGMVSATKDLMKITGNHTRAYVQGYFQYDGSS